MTRGRKERCLLMLLICLVLSACQTQFVSGGSLGLRDYPDSVVHINQVDPAYRSYFAAQHGASYSLSDQRKAFSAARETARTPVRESAYRPARTAPRKKVTSRKKARSSRSRSTAGKNKSTARRKTATKGRTSAKGKRKSGRKSSARRSSRRR